MYRKTDRHFRSDPCLLIGRLHGKLTVQVPSSIVDHSFPHFGNASASPFLTPESETAPFNFSSQSLAIDNYVHVKMQVSCAKIENFVAMMRTEN